MGIEMLCGGEIYVMDWVRGQRMKAKQSASPCIYSKGGERWRRGTLRNNKHVVLCEHLNIQCPNGGMEEKRPNRNKERQNETKTQLIQKEKHQV